MKNKSKKIKSPIQKLTTLFIVLSVISIIAFTILYVVNYNIDNSQLGSQNSELKNTVKKDVISALVCGVNDNLTDTIIYVRYNVLIIIHKIFYFQKNIFFFNHFFKSYFTVFI